MTKVTSLFLFIFLFISIVVGTLYFIFSKNEFKFLLKQSLRKASPNFLIERIKHWWKIRLLRKKYANIPKAPSTFVRSFWVVAASIVSLYLGFYILDCLSKDGGCLNLKILHIQQIDSKVLSSAAVLLMSSPIIFMVWAYRDANKLREIEQARKDINLKEFQKLQEWATGNISGSDKNPEKSLVLQISALHSLRPYLKGEFGEGFKRSAYEIFISVLKTQHQKILKLLEENQLAINRENILNIINEEPLTQQVNQIASEDWFNLIVNHDYPTKGISLIGVYLKEAYLMSPDANKYLDLSDAQLQGANLAGVSLKGANLNRAELQGVVLKFAELRGANLHRAELLGADLTYVKLQDAYLTNSKLQAANLGAAQLQGANLEGAELQGAYLSFAQLQGACLKVAQLQGANLEGAQLQVGDLSNAQLQGADLSFAKLIGANLESASLQAANLKYTDFTGAILYCAGMEAVHLFRTKIIGADLCYTNLRGAGFNLVDNLTPSERIVNSIDKISDIIGFYESSETTEPNISKTIDIIGSYVNLFNKKRIGSIMSSIELSKQYAPLYCDIDTANLGSYTKEEAQVWIDEIKKWER